MSRRTAPPRPPAAPPATAEEGAARVSAAVVPMFDKRDGTGANWRLMVDSLFRCAFDLLDKLPEDQRRKLAGLVHEGSYRRMTGEPVEGDAAARGTSPATSAPSNSAGPKSSGPRPPGVGR